MPGGYGTDCEDDFMEKKVFGYPVYDETGEKVLTTYDNAYADMLMDIRVYRMMPGQVREFCRDGEEMAVLLLSGKITPRTQETPKAP